MEPVYKIQRFNAEAKTIPWDGLDQLLQTFHHGWVVLWQHHGVFVGEITENAVEWLGEKTPDTGDEHLVRLRVFDQDHEFHFWRSSTGIKGRLRIDHNGEGTECIDTEMILRGVIAEPLQKEAIQLGPKETLTLQTRNYIDYHPETQQAGYVDCRFVEFLKKKK